MRKVTAVFSHKGTKGNERKYAPFYTEDTEKWSG